MLKEKPISARTDSKLFNTSNAASDRSGMGVKKKNAEIKFGKGMLLRDMCALLGQLMGPLIDSVGHINKKLIWSPRKVSTM